MKRLLLVSIYAAAITQAATVFNTGPTMINGIAENASANFSVSTNSVTIQLANNITDPTSVNQNIIGVSFSLSNGPAYLTSIAANPVIGVSGSSEMISTNGSFSNSGIFLGAIQSAWLGSYIGSNQLQLSLRADPAMAYSVVGGPGANNLYDGLPAAMAGVPFLSIAPSFTVTVQGVTATTQVSHVQFLYANSPNNQAGIQAVPEPATFGLLGAALCALAFVSAVVPGVSRQSR